MPVRLFLAPRCNRDVARVTRALSRPWLCASVCAALGGCLTPRPAPPAPAETPGTPAWEAAVRAKLVASADADRSGWLEAAEVPTIACTVWQAIDDALRQARGTTLEVRYGFEPGYMFRGAALAIAPAAREAVRARLTECVTPSDADRAGTAALVRALADLPEPTRASWDRSAAELLRAAFDEDHSGALDRGDELTRVPCAVWFALEDTALAARNLPFMALYGFADGYEYVGDALGVREPMREVAADLMRACGLSPD